MIGWTYCSGLMTAEMAAPEIEWRLAAEIEPLPREIAIRKAGYQCARRGSSPRVLWSDFSTIRARFARRFGIPFPEILTAGTPCQSFSLAGLRRGLSDPRGSLTLELIRHVRFLRSLGLRWLVWENVPGVLGHPDNPFGCFLSGIVGGNDPLRAPDDARWPDSGMVAGPLGRACWRILGAQHFGVPQRRNRVFVVANFGDDGDPAAILFERQSGVGHSKTRPKEGAIANAYSRSSIGGGGGPDARDVESGRLIVEGHHGDLAGTVSSKWHKGSGGPSGDETQNMVAFSVKDYGADASELSPPVRAMGFDGSHPNTGGPIAVATQGAVIRRITPRECERLFGMPDDWSLIDLGSANRRSHDLEETAEYLMASGYSAAEAEALADSPDGPRFRALGGAIAVPVLKWILDRILAADEGSSG